MRLLFLQGTSVFETHGGIEYYLDDLLQLGAEVWGSESQETLVPDHGGFELKPRPYQVTRVPMQLSGWISKLENRYSPIYFKTALSRIRANRPDYLVCGHVSLGPLTAALSWMTGIPFLSCAYGIEVWGDLLPQDEWGLRNGAGVLSISEWTKCLLVQRGIPAGKIHVVHPRLDSRYEHQAIPERQDSGPLRLLTVSRLDASEQYKGHDHVLRALSLIRQVAKEAKFHYTVQGDGTDRERLERLAQELGLQDCVEFRGSVADRSELFDLYRASDLFVMPSRFGRWGGKWRGEGFGIVYLEAAALGLPSLAYNCGGATDIMEDGKTGFLAPADDIAGMAKLLLELSARRSYLREIGRNAHAMVNERFGRTAIREEWKSALAAITKASPETAKASQYPQPGALPDSPL